MKPLHIALASGAALFGLALSAGATPMQFSAQLGQLNGSGVTGSADLTYNPNAQTLRVQTQASGLEANKPHAQHLHGLFSNVTSGQVVDSTSPTMANDSDDDGFVEFKEALPAYGPVLIPLTSPPGGNKKTGPGFPTAPDGTIDFSQTYDLTDAGIFSGGYSASDLFPLTDREIVIHGKTLSAGQGADGGEADGTAGYKGVLPVASGVITQTQAVPEPSVLGLMGLGLVMLSTLALRDKRSGVPSLGRWRS